MSKTDNQMKDLVMNEINAYKNTLGDFDNQVIDRCDSDKIVNDILIMIKNHNVDKSFIPRIVKFKLDYLRIHNGLNLIKELRRSMV